MWGVNFFPLCFISLLWSSSAVAKLAYGCAFSEEAKECENFKNDAMNTNGLKLNGDEGLGFNGNVELTMPIEVGYEMCAEAWKVTEIGDEMIFSACGDICNNLDDPNTPWYPIFKALNATKCPIEAKIHHVDDMSISLDFASDVLSHEWCGDYTIQLTMMDVITKLSCHVLTISIFEYESDE